MSIVGRISPFLAALAAIVFVGHASASVVGNNTGTFVHDGSLTDPSYMTSLGPASATDLINQGESSFLSQNTTGFPTTPGTFFGDPTALNNGSLGTSLFGPDNVFDDTDNVYTTTFTLDTSVITQGYKITGITSHSGYSGDRVAQRYNVLYTRVGSSTFQPVTTVDFEAGVNGEYQSTRVDVTDTTGILVSNVSEIRFEILVPTDHLGSSYREFDVFGAAAPLPEPGAIALVSLGGMMLIRRSRRRA